MKKWIKKIKKELKGQGVVEYALILALISIVAVGALRGLGGNIKDTFQSVTSDTEKVTPIDPAELVVIGYDQIIHGDIIEGGYESVSSVKVSGGGTDKYIYVFPVEKPILQFVNFVIETLGTDGQPAYEGGVNISPGREIDIEGESFRADFSRGIYVESSPDKEGGHWIVSLDHPAKIVRISRGPQ